jgi:hypothetical protein
MGPQTTAAEEGNAEVKIVIGMLIAVFTACAVYGQAAAPAAALPKAEALFDKYVEATGGKAAYDKRRTEITKGVVRMAAAGVTGTVEIYSAAPNSQVTIMDVQGVGRIEQGTDGVNAWEVSAVMGPRLKDGQEKTEAFREALFNLPINWRKLYSKVETVAAEKTEGIDCYRVVATPNSGGKPETFWFDVKTGFTVKIKRVAVTSMGEIPAEIVMQDFKPAGGVVQPMTLIQRASGQQVLIQLQSVTPNAVIPKTRFAPPAEIQQLMGKKPAA